MPIIRKKKESGPSLPAEFGEQARAALYFQVASQYYEEKYRDVKTAFFSLVEGSDAVTLEAGKSLKFHEGLLRWQTRSNWNVDAEEVFAALKGKTITVESLLACVKSFNVEMLRSLVPGSVSEGEPTEFGVMQANADFKAQVVEKIESNERLLEQFRQERTEADGVEADAGEAVEAEPVAQPVAKKVAGRAKARRNAGPVAEVAAD